METNIEMKEVIKNIVMLATKYADVAVQLGFPDGHNELRKSTDLGPEGQITVYLANGGKARSVYFEDVEIMLYSEKITFPWYYDEITLLRIYNDVKDFFDVFRGKKENKLIKAAIKSKEEMIAKLEKELAELKEKQMKGIES